MRGERARGQNPRWPPKLHIRSYLCSQLSQKDDLDVYFRGFLVKDFNSDDKIVIKSEYERSRGQNPKWPPKLHISSSFCSQWSQKGDLGVYFRVFLAKDFNSDANIMIK